MPDIAVFALFFAVGIVTLYFINRRGNTAAFVTYLIVFTLFSAYMLICAGNSFMIKLIAPMFDGGKWILDSQAATFGEMLPYIMLSFALLVLFSLFITASAIWSMLKVLGDVKDKFGKHNRDITRITETKLPRKQRFCGVTIPAIRHFCRMNC